MTTRRLNLVRRISIFVFLAGTIFFLTAWQAHESGSPQPATAVKSPISQNQQAVEAAPVMQAPLITKDIEGDIVALCSHTLKAIEVIIAVAGTVLALLSIFNLGGILRYGSRIERIDAMRRELQKDLETLKDKTAEISGMMKELETKRGELEQTEKRIQESLKVDSGKLISLTNMYKVLASNVGALRLVLQIQNTASPRRLQDLMELGQMRHPVGVAPMVAILLNKNEIEEVRLNAAYGLGRYSEDKDTSDYWRQILEGFTGVMEDHNTPETVIEKVFTASASYDRDASPVFSAVLEWSYDARPSIRKRLLEDFGRCRHYDRRLDERFREMAKNDPAPEVREAAEKAGLEM